MFARLVQGLARALDRISPQPDPASVAAHQLIGRRGEEDVYFYLRKLGYVIVARNYRSRHHRGEIDLIGWDEDILCFVEVKTRTSREVKPAEAAVDKDKQRQIVLVARDYLQHLPPSCQWRFDIVSVYYEEQQTCRPKFELFKNAFPMS
jgi:putative endonuclease